VKDVTAFANSAGGQIIYGIPEKNGVPQPLDCGVDRAQISPEWIDQVISTNASPRVQNLGVTSIPLDEGATHFAYVLSIPQATSFAPHQNTLDHKYYRRSELRSIPMYDYEVRDVLRRATTPELWIDFNFDTGKTTTINFASNSSVSDPIKLVANIGNKSQQPASYAVITVLIDELLAITSGGGLSHRGVLAFRGHSLKVFSLNLGGNAHLPIFAEVKFLLTDTPLAFTLDLNSLQSSDFYIGYEIHTPGFSTQKFVHIIKQPGQALKILDETDA
jgi:hypothetical protein